uniref:Uncharacterized protein n=1 Tax=Cucumis sativus TaxID=3659 RepID=A0A0A0LC60_CUCSA
MGGFGLACYVSLGLNLPHRNVVAHDFLCQILKKVSLHKTQLPTNIAEANGEDGWSIFQNLSILETCRSRRPSLLIICLDWLTWMVLDAFVGGAMNRKGKRESLGRGSSQDGSDYGQLRGNGFPQWYHKVQ